MGEAAFFMNVKSGGGEDVRECPAEVFPEKLPSCEELLQQPKTFYSRYRKKEEEKKFYINFLSRSPCIWKQSDPQGGAVCPRLRTSWASQGKAEAEWHAARTDKNRNRNNTTCIIKMLT